MRYYQKMTNILKNKLISYMEKTKKLKALTKIKI
jgi:hypothetical protein